METAVQDFGCSIVEVASYLDGELSPSRELEMESHFAVCRPCVAELNAQKQFLCSLESSLHNEEEIELPEEFTRHVVANAESSVSGLMRPGEGYNVIFVCVGLFVFVLFALGAEAERMFAGIFSFFERAGMVGSIFGHLVYSFLVGLVIVVRSFASQIGSEPAAGVAFSALVTAGIMLASLKLLPPRKA